MREIKFRAYCSFDKTWHYWTVYESYPQGIYGGLSEPQQYTGLKDKDGVEIYEGDILGFSENFKDNKILSKVVWTKAYSGEQWCEIEIRDYNGCDVQSDDPDDFYGGVNTQKVVVGNIFEGVKNEEANIH